MRVVHVCRSAPPVVGGLERAVEGLATHLARRGHDVVLASFVDGATPGVRRVHLGRLGPKRWPFARGLSQALAGADLIHVHGIDGLLDQVLVGHAAPVGVSTHGGYFHTRWAHAAKVLWSRTGTVVSLRAADGVWWTSEADRARYPWAPDGAVEPPGVDVERFAAATPAPDPRVWRVPGRIDVHKGHLDLLPVLARLRDHFDTVEILGPVADPRLPAAIGKLASRLGLGGRVVLRGVLEGEAWVEALSTAGLVVSPSRSEGFGIAAVEALAAGARTVLSDIPAHRAHAGVAPLLPMDRPDDAAAAVLAALAAPWDVDRARRHAAQFGWPARTDAFEARYRSLLGTA